MKICYLIQAHTDPVQLKRLINALDNNKNKFVIHIDGKADITGFYNCLKESSNIHFIKNRVLVHWGGFSQVEAILKLIEKGLDLDCDRYTYISGLDYPLWSNEKIEQFWINNTDRQYCSIHNISDSNDPYDYEKICHPAFWDLNIKNEKLFNKSRNLINKVLKLIPRKRFVTIGSKVWKIYWGSSWWSLNKDVLQYAFNEFQSNKKLRRYIKWSFPPDELWMPTVLANSKYYDSLVELTDNKFEDISILHKVDYTNGIKIWTLDDKEEVFDSDRMFIRKTTSDKSLLLQDYIDKEKRL